MRCCKITSVAGIFLKMILDLCFFSKKKKCHIQALWVTVASGGIVTSFTNPVSDI